MTKTKKPGIEILDARLLRFPPFTPHLSDWLNVIGYSMIHKVDFPCITTR
jgi:hypothetical protein